MTERQWTYQKLLAEFKKYDKLSDVMYKSRAAYNAAHKYGVAEQLVNESGITKKRSVTINTILAKSSQYTDVGVWRQENQYDYQLCVKKGWLKEATSHMHKKYDRGIDIHQMSEVISKYKTLNQFRNDNPKMYDKIRKNGLTKLLSGLKRYSGSTT